ncbi:glutamate 5-kinase [Phaeobacter gallaeciensis]|uniref:glutamate 5-kinase n=1 Tax=Phaeobacter gallaeciensis TaxID=60890 RepID=UPI00237F00DD|nr:glutamate 5-kinase [Phaeobacter gallaeciensis]MDE4192667.1 glutamate 5-kinase [Phaeobacter gallaeciensis]MDE4201236.1 glutamate 5-kinase [Phaeobacter gallaeciensis]MDE4205283.1 glutamate 5-kinase [Phaeobacter gallaeciensis]MDE4209559.1 glutamate 5-kinase [Phaeobacter gallaeciensis]MDE4217790.1 glutamate 5-kinase [Phaeobacter gallaeciensis]
MAALSDARRIVIKIGSALLVDRASGQLRSGWLHSLANDVAWLKSLGKDVVIVSSGSIALGRGVLDLPRRELPLEQSQAAAAVGQIRLARAYEEALAPHGITTAQVLVTLEDSSDRRRYLNSRATLETLIGLGAVPIVNENDTIATDEIRYGDNDRLAAQVAVTVGADTLVLLSDVDGFYSANPAIDPEARRFDRIEEITPEIEAMAGDGVSGLSKGGMITKLMSAKMATAAGCAMVITEGSALNPLKALEDGVPCTWFVAQGDPQAARKRWIAAMKTRGVITIDEGAANALMNGNSLLPAGVRYVEGDFGRGEPLAILGPDGRKLGQGLSRYTGDEARAIQGRQSAEIEATLGYPGRAALIHRDDIAF